jgi:D-aminoacyl-tRNA deacylase
MACSGRIVVNLRHNTRQGDPPSGCMEEGVVLLVACDADEASSVMADALRSRGVFVPYGMAEGADVLAAGRVRLWCRTGTHLHEDNLDLRYTEALGEGVQEVLFLSKHVASSERPCLTVHPIGVPHLSEGETPPFGGRAGQSPPPSVRMAAIWRALLAVRNDPRIPEFEVSLEVTHHGPWLTAPSAFLEIGSTSTTWSHGGAGQVWADLLLDLLSEELQGRDAPNQPPHHPVLITLGGGHYAPRANMMAAEQGALLGHMLARHSLPFEPSDEGTGVGGAWKHAINESLASTRRAHPGRTVVVSMDKKSFRGWERAPLLEHLASLKVQVVSADEHRAMLSTE